METTNTQKITVCIDDLLKVTCDGFINGGERWNGFEQPIFNAEQLETISQWFNEQNIGEEDGSTFEEQVTDLGQGCFVLYGWVWQLSPDFDR